jgi:hypothetical protein
MHGSCQAKTTRGSGDQHLLIIERTRRRKRREEEFIPKDDLWHSQHLGDPLNFDWKSCASYLNGQHGEYLVYNVARRHIGCGYVQGVIIPPKCTR